MKKAFKCLILIISVIMLSISSHATSVSWYCIRNKNHEQPKLDKTLSVVEKYDVFWVDKAHDDISDDDKVIYLTFDAGYENGNVEKIVDILNKHEVKGGFFVLDNILTKNHSLIEKMIDGSHTIANHTARHRDMSKINSKEEFKAELEALEKLFEKEYGRKMVKLYRPPEGRFSEENLKWASELGYKTVMWSFAYADWDNDRQMSCESAKNKILENLHNGEIMLLHPTSSTNAEIIEDLIVELKNKGFRFGSLEELCYNDLA